MTDDIDQLITDDMRACIGLTTPSWEMPDVISTSDVRRFCDVIGETNKLYCDAAYARSLGYKGQVVPPTLITQFFWRMRGTEAPEWPGLKFPSNYTNARNASQDFTWLQPVYVGDRLTLQQSLKDIYVRQNRRGIAVIYMMQQTDVRNQDGDLVAIQVGTTARMPARSVTKEN